MQMAKKYLENMLNLISGKKKKLYDKGTWVAIFYVSDWQKVRDLIGCIS